MPKTNPRALIALLRRWIRAFLQPIPFAGILGLPRYVGDWLRFRHDAEGNALQLIDSYPCLSDRTFQTGFDAHYFFQAAWLARRVAEASPRRHVDIGSDVRMIGVLSAFVETEFIDYRPLPVRLDKLVCAAGNLTSLMQESDSIPSLSCLHVVEHVGLGRYGDPIDPQGSLKALAELARVLVVGGSLFVSVPVGRERICFNAHRVFDPATIVSAMPGLSLREFSLVDDAGRYLERQALTAADDLDYGCGMFHFVKEIT